MQKRIEMLSVFLMFLALVGPFDATLADSGHSTRVTHLKQHEFSGPAKYPFRQKSEYVLKELDLRPGDVVADIGAGDGWWTDRMLKQVGKTGVIHAAEVDKEKVDALKEKYAGVEQVKPYLAKKDSTGLPQESCDLAFFSQVFHHLDRNGEVDYLKHLRKVVKPTGRLVVIERYPRISSRNKAHGTHLSQLIKRAEEAGWIAVRCELMTGTEHYLAIFVQLSLFPKPRRKVSF